MVPPSTTTAWAVGTLALWAAAWHAWLRYLASQPVPVPTQQPAVPLSKPALAFAAVLWMAALAFVIEPLLVHSALLGRADAWHTHRFALAGGWAKPIDPDELFASLLQWIAPRAPASAPPGEAALSHAQPPEVAYAHDPLRGIEGLDTAAGLRRVLDKRPAYESLLRKFVAGQAGAVQATRAAMSAGQHDEALRAMHTLKGTAATIGAEGLAVSAPRWVGLGEIEAALQEKAAWILRKLHEQQERQRRQLAARVDWRDGSVIPFLGESVILVRVETSPEDIKGMQAADGILRLRDKLGAASDADLLRKRDHAEQIALYRGEEAERQQLRVRFQAIAENWWRLMVRERNLGFFVVGYDRVSNIIPIFAALPLFLAKTITLGGLMQVRTAFSAVQGSLSWFIGAYTTLAEWSATVERLGQFEEAIVRTRQQVREPLCGDCLCLDRLDVLLPNGEPLMCDLRGQVQHGEWVRLAGPSGMGKSTLLRTLQGLWPYYRGAWQLPNGRSLLLPQKPYLAALPLRELLVYPSADTVADQRLREVLEQVGLPQLACQLERQTEWERELSGGEQQRLGFARALLFQPHTLYLDEATNQLDDRAAQSLLAMLRRELPQCTVIGVSHQERVQALFDRSLELTAQREELAAAVPA